MRAESFLGRFLSERDKHRQAENDAKNRFLEETRHTYLDSIDLFTRLILPAIAELENSSIEVIDSNSSFSENGNSPDHLRASSLILHFGPIIHPAGLAYLKVGNGKLEPIAVNKMAGAAYLFVDNEQQEREGDKIKGSLVHINIYPGKVEFRGGGLLPICESMEINALADDRTKAQIKGKFLKIKSRPVLESRRSGEEYPMPLF